MYEFDLSRFGAFDFALFLLYARQEDTGALFLHLARFAAFDVATVPLGETPAVIGAFCEALKLRLVELGMGAPAASDQPPMTRPVSCEFSTDGESWTPIGGAAGAGPRKPYRRSKRDAAAEATAKRLIDQALGGAESADGTSS